MLCLLNSNSVVVGPAQTYFGFLTTIKVLEARLRLILLDFYNRGFLILESNNIYTGDHLGIGRPHKRGRIDMLESLLVR